MVPWLVLLVGCLERVTGEAVPLDPRFYEGRDDHGGQGVPGDGGGGPDGGTPGDGMGGGGGSPTGGGEAPWANYDGATWTLRGTLVSESEGEIQLDVNRPDPDSPGGQRREGALRLPGAGTFELAVPTTVAEVRLQAFQDLDADGPDQDDPFAEGTAAWAGADPEPLTLTLVQGARGQAGAPSGAPAGGPAPPPQGLSLPEGPTVTVSGTVETSRDLPVILDFFHANGEGAGGRSYLGKRAVAPGEWSQAFPVDFGRVEIEAYQDLTGDSRTGDDPAARLQGPVTVGSEDITGIALTIP